MVGRRVVIAEDFLDYSGAKLRQFLDRIEGCLSSLDDARIWSRGHETENSIGNLCLHLNGNVRQWIIGGIGGEEDVRDRDSEFKQTSGSPKDELAASLRLTVLDACAVIASLSAARLEDEVTVQGYNMSVLQAVYHVVEHFAQHTGQIVFGTKAITGKDMGFYRHLSGNGRDNHGQTTP